MSIRDAISMHREDTIRELLLSGYQISLIKGRLQLSELGGPLSRPNRLEGNLDELVCGVIASTCPEMKVFRFESHSVSKYGGGRFPGVCLQFRELASGLNGYAIYNARLTRDRNTTFGKKGSLLPAGQFHVVKGASLRKLWLSTDIKEPKLSAYHCRMGLLKPLYFVGQFLEGEKLNKCTLKPASISSSEIDKQILFADDQWLISRHTVDSERPSTVDSKFNEPKCGKGLEAKSSAGSIDCGKKVIRGKVKGDSSISNDDWIKNYDQRGDIFKKATV